MKTFKIISSKIDSQSNPYNGVEKANYPITDKQAFIDLFNKQTQHDTPYSLNKYFCIMYFKEILSTDNKTTLINTKNAYYRNGLKALLDYSTTYNIAKLIDATSITQLITKRNNILKTINKSNRHILN